jgi:anti-sigma factor RsiW
MICKEYSERLDLFEDYLDGRLEGDAEATVTSHFAHCSACREAVESARLAGILLRAAMEPTAEPDEVFWTRVRAHLREEEKKSTAAGVQDFWPALEWLARRLTLTSAVALLVMFGFLLWPAPTEPARQSASGQTEVREIFPDTVRQPVNQNEVLVSLASAGNKR